MDERLIIGMVTPYLKEKELTYNEFEHIFSMLSLKEQYDVVNVLNNNSIVLVDNYQDADKSDTEFADNYETDEDEFELLYDYDLFSQNVQENENFERKGIPKEIYVKERKIINLSNRTLIRLIQDGDEQAKQDLCVKNRGLVDKWAYIYQHVMKNKMDLEDLRQVGMMGMIKAAERFDLDMGTEFSTYAVWWIRQAITREITDSGYTIRIPVHKMEQIHSVMRLDAKYTNESDYSSRIKLISENTNLDIKTVEECIFLYHQIIGASSLDLPVGEDEDTTLGDYVPYENGPSVEDIVSVGALKESIMEVLHTLSEREQEIICMRYGLDDGREKTLEEVGRKYGITRERVRQIEERVLKKLRLRSNRIGLNEFLS